MSVDKELLFNGVKKRTKIQRLSGQCLKKRSGS
jgi:hypothetical protein